MRKRIGIFLLFFCFNTLNANEVNIFSARHYDSDVQFMKNLLLKLELKLT